MRAKVRPKVIFTKDLRVIYYGKKKATSLDLKKFVLPVIGVFVFLIIIGVTGSSDYANRYGM